MATDFTPPPYLMEDAQAGVYALQEEGHPPDGAESSPSARPEIDPLEAVRALCPEDDVDWRPRDELVSGLIFEGDKAMLFGSSNTGKTFCALELAACVVTGKPFLGRQVKRGQVLYCAAESPDGIRMRCQALRRYKGYRLRGLTLIRIPLDMYSSEESSERIIAAARRIEQDSGQPISLVVFDTLAQISAGAQENSNSDMSVVMGRIGAVRQALADSCTALIIHHIGKARQSNGVISERGASAVRADVDCSLFLSEVEGYQGIIKLEATKMRDGAKGEYDLAFRLATRDMGQNNFRRISTCTVEQAELPKSAEDVKDAQLDKDVAELVEKITRRAEEGLEPLPVSRACRMAFSWGQSRGDRVTQVAIDRGLLTREVKDKGRGCVLVPVPKPEAKNPCPECPGNVPAMPHAPNAPD